MKKCLAVVIALMALVLLLVAFDRTNSQSSAAKAAGSCQQFVRNGTNQSISRNQLLQDYELLAKPLFWVRRENPATGIRIDPNHCRFSIFNYHTDPLPE